MIPPRAAVILFSCLVAAPAVATSLPAWTRGPAAPVFVADSEPQLPEGSMIVGPVRRGKNGELEILDPTTAKGDGPARCSTGTLCVGPKQAYATLSDAAAAARIGDVIEVLGGVYHESARIGQADVIVRGVGGTPHFDCQGIRPAADKACILLAANGITLENLEISGARIADNLGANAACIRNEPNRSFTLRGIICHGSQDGILTDGGTIVIENSQFYENGLTDYTHNVYFSGACESVTVRGSTFRDAQIGHEFKSRCQHTTISDSTFRSTKGSRDLDIPDGGETMIYRSQIFKTVGSQSEEIIGFAAESCKYPGSMTLKDVRVINSRSPAVIHNFDKCEGKPIVLDGVTFQDITPRLQGYILTRNAPAK